MHFLSIAVLFFVTSCQEFISVKHGNIAAPAPAPYIETSWIRQIGFETLGASSASGEACYKVETDSNGNIYCAGFTAGSLGEATAGSDDAFIMKLSPSGSLIWIKQFGAISAPTATGSEIVYSLKVDAAGNIYAAGVCASLAEPNAGGYDIFVTKLNSSGDIQWIKQFGATTTPTATANEYPSALALDALGNIYIGGQTHSSLFEANGGGGDIFLMQLNSSGDLNWGKQFGAVTAPGAASSAHDGCSDIHYKSDSEIYCGGFTGSALAEANGGSSDVMLMKFNSTGVVSWITQLGATTIGANAAGNETCAGLDLDTSGNIFCGGQTTGNLAEINGGANDIIVAKFSSAGAPLWIKQLGSVTMPGAKSSAADNCLALKLDSSGNIFCAGTTGGALGETFGGGTNNPYILKMTPAGDISWVKQLGADTFPSVVQLTGNPCRDLAIHNNQPICAGRTGSQFAETNTGNAGDLLIFKLKSDGTLDL